MTEAKQPGDDLDKTSESIELAGTLDAGDSVVSPADVQAAKIHVNTPVDLPEPDVVHNIDDLESMVFDSGSDPEIAKQESASLVEEMDAAAEAIATLIKNREKGTESAAEDEAETVKTAIKPVDDQVLVSGSQGREEKAKRAAIDLDNPPAAKQKSAVRPTGKLPLFGLLFGLLGIAAGLGAGFYAYLLQGKLAVLDQRVEATVHAPTPAEGALSDVALLHIRVEEIARLIEESSHIQDSSGAKIDSLKSRIAQIEQKINVLRDNAADRNPATEAEIPSPVSDDRISSVPVAKKGSWAVNLDSHTSEKVAEAAVNRLRSQGINAEKYSHVKDGTTWYRVRVPGFSSSAEAQAYAENVLPQAGFSQAWIGRMQ